MGCGVVWCVWGGKVWGACLMEYRGLTFGLRDPQWSCLEATCRSFSVVWSQLGKHELVQCCHIKSVTQLPLQMHFATRILCLLSSSVVHLSSAFVMPMFSDSLIPTRELRQKESARNLRQKKVHDLHLFPPLDIHFPFQ